MRLPRRRSCSSSCLAVSASAICHEPASNFIATYRVSNKATIAAASEAEDMLSSKEDAEVSEGRECRNDTHGIMRFYIAQSDVIIIPALTMSSSLEEFEYTLLNHIVRNGRVVGLRAAQINATADICLNRSVLCRALRCGSEARDAPTCCATVINLKDIPRFSHECTTLAQKTNTYV